MKQYLDLLNQVLNTGNVKKDRTGTGTISLFGLQQRYDLTQGFPAVTTKKLAWRSVVSELLWFIEGSGDELRLREILHGNRESEKTTIWTDNANAENWLSKRKFVGDLGRIYGVQWRHWRTPIEHEQKIWKDDFGNQFHRNGFVHIKETDQLVELIKGIKQNPESRRHILSAWNPGEIDEMALPPCHSFAQFYVYNRKLSCQMYQRSADLFLGVPFNIASYSLLTHMIAQVCDLEVGEFVHVLGDAHIYLDHVDQVKQQLARSPRPLPKLWLNPEVNDICKFSMDDIKLENYQHHPPIKGKMSV
jgi:thymidylate synthase